MKPVQIKRHKHKKIKIGTKEKILAGIGLASNLIGGGVGVASQKSSVQIVAANNQSKNASDSRNLIDKIFHIKVAQADISRAGFLQEAANSNYDTLYAKYGDSMDSYIGQWLSDASQMPSVFGPESLVAQILGLVGANSPGANSSGFTYGADGLWHSASVVDFSSGPSGGSGSDSTVSAGTVSRMVLDKNSFDLRVGQSDQTRVFVDYLLPNGTYTQDSLASVASSNQNVAVASISGGVINIQALTPGQSVITVHAQGAGDDVSKDQKIFVRVSAADVSVSSLQLLDSSGKSVADSVSVASNRTMNLSAIVNLSDGTRSPNVTVTKESDQNGNVAGVSATTSGQINITAYNPFSNLSSDQQSDQTFSATFRIHPSAASDSSQDKLLTVYVYNDTSSGPGTQAPNITPAYISDLAGQRQLNNLNDTELAELADYFSQSDAVLPDTFIAGSFAASALGMGSDIPTSSNGLMLYAITLGYTYKNGQYQKSFDLPALSSTATISLRDPYTGQVLDNLLISHLEKAGAAVGVAGAMAAANTIHIYLASAVGSASRTIMAANGGIAAASASSAIHAIWAFATNPATIAVTVVEGVILLVNKYTEWKQHAHFKIDDSLVANAVMPKIFDVVNTYNSNASTSPEEEQEMHDVCVQLVWALFSGMVPYVKLDSSVQSQKGYVQQMVNGMDSTLQQRLVNYQGWYSRLIIFQDPQGNRQTTLSADDTAFKLIIVSSDGRAWSETGKAVPASLVNAIKNASGSQVNDVAALDKNPFTETGATGLNIVQSSLPSAVVGRPYSQILSVSQDHGDLAWAIVGGQVPQGLFINSVSGELSFVPDAQGSFAFTVQASDNSGNVATKNYILIVNGDDNGGGDVQVTEARILAIVNQANILQYNDLSSDEQQALTDYLTANPASLVNQSFSNFAPGSVFAWDLGMGADTNLNVAALSLGFVRYDSSLNLFVKTAQAESDLNLVQGTSPAATVTGTSVVVNNASGNPMTLNGSQTPNVGYIYNSGTSSSGQVIFNVSINGGATYTNMTISGLLAKIQQDLASTDPQKVVEGAALSNLYYANVYNSQTAFNSQGQATNNPSSTSYAGGTVNYSSGGNVAFENPVSHNLSFGNADSWQLTVSGAKASQNIFIDGTWTKPNGELVQLHELVGMTDSNGHAVISRQLSSYHAGNWNIQIIVGGQAVGANTNFVVNA